MCLTMLGKVTNFLLVSVASLVFMLPVHEAKTSLLFPGVEQHVRRAQLNEQASAVLLQADAEEAGSAATDGASGSVARTQHGKARQPKNANWFGVFDEAESTYDAEADGARAHLDDNMVGAYLEGWDPRLPKESDQDVKEPVFFDESKSAAYKEAWQTHFPALTGSLNSGGASPGKWYQAAGGPWQQEYVDSKSYMERGPVPASWFDNSVSQYDGFGRQKFANSKTPRSYWDFEERSVNTTLSCDKPGCIANVSLKAPFDPATEIARNCRLSVFFHPTDFDQYYSGEKVEWIDVSNARATSSCYPMAHGCNATAAKRLIPCLSGLAIDSVLAQPNSSGAITIASKITDVVDECPYKKDEKDTGSYLAAVPMITCMVKPIELLEKSMPPPVKPVAISRKVPCKSEAPIKCTTRGCEASGLVQVSNFCGQPGNKCKLNLTVHHTDFDNLDKMEESIEFIKVGGVTVKEKVFADGKTGKNPCKTAWGGQPQNESDLVYVAVENQDVSENATTGMIKVEGKISDNVDECAYDGYLFSGLITVDCGEIETNETVDFTAESPKDNTTELAVKEFSRPSRLLRGSLSGKA